MPERRLAKVTSCRHPERVAAIPVRKAPATRAVANDPKFTGTAASTPGRGSAAPAEPPTAGAIVHSNASAHRPRVRDMSETGAKIFQLDLEGWHRSMHTTAVIASTATHYPAISDMFTRQRIPSGDFAPIRPRDAIAHPDSTTPDSRYSGSAKLRTWHPERFFRAASLQTATLHARRRNVQEAFACRSPRAAPAQPSGRS